MERTSKEETKDSEEKEDENRMANKHCCRCGRPLWYDAIVQSAGHSRYRCYSIARCNPQKYAATGF